jgi:hypothetical protein
MIDRDKTIDQLAEEGKLQIQREWEAKAKAATLTLPWRDGATQAPGYREVGMFFSCIPDVEHPWNPEVVKAIWEFDPHFVPCYLKWVFLAPEDQSTHGSEVVFGRHVLARHVESPVNQLEDFECSMPPMPCQGITFKRPTVLVNILMKPNLDSDLPGEYIEFDMSVVSWMRSKFIENTTPAEEARNYVASAKIANERRKEALKMDMAARYGDVNKYITKRMQDVSDVEVKDYLRRMSAGSR